MQKRHGAWLAIAVVAVAVVAQGSSPALTAQDWRQFRGPTGQGVADATGLPVEWSTTKNIAWKTAVPGRGWSSPVVAHGRVWVTTAVADKRDTSLRLMSFDVD